KTRWPGTAARIREVRRFDIANCPAGPTPVPGTRPSYRFSFHWQEHAQGGPRFDARGRRFSPAFLQPFCFSARAFQPFCFSARAFQPSCFSGRVFQRSGFSARAFQPSCFSARAFQPSFSLLLPLLLLLSFRLSTVFVRFSVSLLASAAPSLLLPFLTSFLLLPSLFRLPFFLFFPLSLFPLPLAPPRRRHR